MIDDTSVFHALCLVVLVDVLSLAPWLGRRLRRESR